MTAMLSLEKRNSSDNSLLAHYRYGHRQISLETGMERQYYHHDALGSTVNLTDSTGGVKVSYTLDPWGHIKNQTGEIVNRQIFTGQEHDGKTGLIYFGARYYDPDTARFITQDAYLGEIGTPPNLHRYSTVYVDLFGYKARITKWLLTCGERFDLTEEDEAGLRHEVASYDFQKQVDWVEGRNPTIKEGCPNRRFTRISRMTQVTAPASAVPAVLLSEPGFTGLKDFQDFSIADSGTVCKAFPSFP
ncbi:MAG: RHS repeat domain-containing protein [Desulfococcaceae bacterium]